MSSTYQTLASLRAKLSTTKQKDRRQAFKDLLELLSNNSTIRNLHFEAERTYSPNDKIYPEERVSILLRNILDASLVASQSVLSETKKKTANGTGFIKQSTKFTQEDILFPQRVFLRVDGALECYTGYSSGSTGQDWKNKPRYCHHLDPSGEEGFTATFYPGDEEVTPSKSNLTSKEILASISYIISCLNNRDCCELAEVELMQWLSHICARPDYVTHLPIHAEISYVLHEISCRIYAEFGDMKSGSRGNKSSFVGMHSSSTSKQVRQECLVACAKALSGLVYNTTTRLGMSMQLYLRPIVELVAWYAEHAWTYQLGGGAMSSTSSSKHHRTEMDVVSLLPHLYAAVTHLLAAHPEQSVAVLSETGHALLRLAKKNYLKSATDPQLRDALTEYIGAHLLIAETSGKLYGLPEGDVGPLIMESEENGNDDVALGASLDKKTIDNLLELVRDEKVWESLFASSDLQDAKKSKPYQRNRFRSQKKKRGGGITVEGGAKWTPLNKRQRRYLELVVRLLRLSQRLNLAEVEALGNGSTDPFDSVMMEAEKMMHQQSDIEYGEIDVDTGFTLTSGVDFNKQLVSDEALAETPFVTMICQHLYKLNPKLGNAAASAKEALDASMTQSTVNVTQMLTQSIQESAGSNDRDVSSLEQSLLKSCPILRALVAKAASRDKYEATPHSTVSILQLICASAEAFPRGECWSSSARDNWSTTLDENTYYGGASAHVRERHGSSLADAASLVYLLGTTLESCGGSGGDDNVQVWTLVALLKMVESGAIISTREGVRTASLEALNLAWQYVWKTLFRFDVRYSSYTSGAYASNAGELVLQLLTQIIRHQCTDQRAEIQPMSSFHSSFIQAQTADILKLPVFDKPSSILSGTCFELVTALAQFTEVPNDSSMPMGLPDISIVLNRDRKWLISFCLKFMESSLMESASDSMVQRSCLPFAATCLACLLSDGNIVENASTFELDSLTRFSVTEDTCSVCVVRRPELDPLGCKFTVNDMHHMLWKGTLAPFFHPNDCGILMQGRGAVLNELSDSVREREKLYASYNSDTGSTHFVQRHRSLGDAAFDRVKTMFDEILFGIRYGSDEEDESEGENALSKRKSNSDTPKISACLSLLLTVVVSSRANIKDIADYIAEVTPGTILRVFDHLPEVLDALALSPRDLLSVLNHLDGVLRILAHVAAADQNGSKISDSLQSQFRAMFSACKGILRNHRHEMYSASTLTSVEPARQDYRRRPAYESDDDYGKSQVPLQRLTQRSQLDNDSDGFMDDAEVIGPVRLGSRQAAHLKRIAPPPKRRRVEKDPVKVKQSLLATVDCQGAWACASLMILMNPSIECLEIIAGHLVWPEDYNSENGYNPVSKSINPFGAIVCASLFCQKQIVRRENMLRSGTTMNSRDDQQSAIVLCVEVILQARRHLSTSSPHFMFGLNLLLDLIEFGDRNDSCHSISAAESKFIVDALYPEGLNQDNENYKPMRALKKVIKYRCFYRAEQLRVSIGLFLRGQENVHAALDSIFSEYFIKVRSLSCSLTIGLNFSNFERMLLYTKSSFCQLDEKIRMGASDALGVALGGFPDQQMIVSEVNRSILPPLKSEKRFMKWTNALVDPKTPVDLSQLEQSALTDGRLSFEFRAIDCIGLIAGSTTDESVSVDMVWKLLDLAAHEPAMGLLCRRACERAALMLGFKSVSELFVDMAPHLLVKWIESRRRLGDFPLLMTSPLTPQIACRFLPNEVLRMLMTDGGWDDKFLGADVSNFAQSHGEQ
jgi:hypothetical protein